MKTIFNKVLAGITSVALVATLLVGINVGTEVKADTVTLTKPWSFFQTGTTTDGWNAWEVCAYSGVTFGDSGVAALTGKDFPYGPAQTYATGSEITATAAGASDTFAATIVSNGWSADYDANLNNPYTLRASMDNMVLLEGHNYTLSFKASASSNKYAIIGGTDLNTNSVFNETIAITTTPATYTYDFQTLGTDTVSFQFMFGAFPILDDVVKAAEVNWAGTVNISDFTITDKGLIDGYEIAPPKQDDVITPDTTVKPTTPDINVKPSTPDPAPAVKKLAKVKKVKAKNNKKKTLKITWKKVTNAKKYQVKVGEKTYNTKKTKLTVKKLKKGKKYIIKVRAKAAGYKTGAWSKKVKVKIKK